MGANVMRFGRLFIVGLLASLLSLSSLAKVYHGSRAVHNSRSSRPYYGGGKHTTSHGGQYPGSTIIRMGIIAAQEQARISTESTNRNI